jgi:hypothetical protein
MKTEDARLRHGWEDSIKMNRIRYEGMNLTQLTLDIVQW